jgi:CRISPR/Cas system Type II protein with McrA/HNH and RuvC-like nuclease domain
MNPSCFPITRFSTGLVFGFDLGTGSIGYAVRHGTEFKDVGVLICPEDTAKLDSRRNLRRQRRTLRSKKYRRQWFARELAGLLGLKLIRHDDEELSLPETAWGQNNKGGWVPKPGFESLCDPVALRVAALEGKPLRPEELFTALTHLFRRRGYLADVPWGNQEAEAKDPDANKEEGEIKGRMSALREEMKAKGCEHPCQLLAVRAKERALWLQAANTGKPLAELWAAENMKGEPPKDEPRQRKEVWPRELVEKEFRAIVAAHASRHPKLAEKADWLLFGDSREVKGHGVYFKTTESRNPGVLGLKWPRFDNRGPALDVLRPLDEQGRPLHVVRKNKEAFTKAQWELAVMNFRVIDRTTSALVAPDARALARLREMWESSRRKRRSK